MLPTCECDAYSSDFAISQLGGSLVLPFRVLFLSLFAVLSQSSLSDIVHRAPHGGGLLVDFKVELLQLRVIKLQFSSRHWMRNIYL